MSSDESTLPLNNRPPLAENPGMNDEKKNKKEAKPRIRTMITDAQEYLKGKRVSATQLLAEQSDKGGLYQRPKQKRLTVLVYAAAAIFIIVLLIGSAFWIVRVVSKPAIEKPSVPNPLIPTTSQEIIELESLTSELFLQEWRVLFTRSLPPREFLQTPIFNKTRNTFLGSIDFFTLLDASPPALLLGSLTNQITLGILDTPRGNELLLLLKARSFSAAFAGMLAWENNLLKDLTSILSQSVTLDQKNNIFQDRVIANHDVRVLENKNDEPIIIYTIFNRQILIIAQSTEAIKSTIKQLSFFPPQ